MVAEVDQIQLAANERLKSIEALQAEIDRIQLVANERLDDIAILQAEVNQIQSIAKDHREEIKALRESISWKATAPLRKLTTVLRSMLTPRGSSD
jgi:peptidoglycan hydrolase CwlO-like protein